MQCYFHDNPDAHRYVSSPKNQRIEGWWSFYSQNRSMLWRNFFKDVESEGVTPLVEIFQAAYLVNNPFLKMISV